MNDQPPMQPPPPPPAFAPPAPPAPAPQQSPAKGLALTALIVGIVAFLIGLLPVVGILAGLTAAIFGIIALVKKQSRGLAITGLVLGVAAVLASSGMAAIISKVAPDAMKASETIIETPTTAPVEPVEEPAAAPEPEEPAIEEEPVDEEPALTLAQENAIGAASSYLGTMAFSKKGLIEQLKYEGYSTKDAEFAIEFIQPNWKKQAAKAAESYLKTMSFSRDSLFEQLRYEGYTANQAAYGVRAVGY